MNNKNFSFTKEKLPAEFYIRDEVTIAKKLLGKLYVRKYKDVFLTGKIVETEAYNGTNDEAAHTYNGKTERNKIMFEQGGYLYVYFTYGMHYCSNVVTGKANEGNAVLIRAIEPVEGIEQMAINRFGKKELSGKEKISLTNGPAKTCMAFDLTKKQNGTSLLGDEIFICNYKKISPANIVADKRIGIKKSVDLPWRFYIKDNPFVSKR